MTDRDDDRMGRRTWLQRSVAGAAVGLIGGSALRALAQDRAPAPPVCALSTADIEGPYYRPGAPLRSDLVDPTMDGQRLWVSGRVLCPDCTTPLAGALLDVWSANAHGHYDNDGAPDEHGRMFLRGRVRTGADGRFAIHTLVPGHYLNGPQYRPSHVHFKVAAPGHQPLTTQLYFPGDPYNAIDPFFHPSRLMSVSTSRGESTGHFDFILAAARR